MRKTFALTLVFCLMLTVTSFASDIDLTSMSDENLLELKTKVDTEITNRGLDDGFELPEGVYKIGTDIKAGSYVFYNLNDSEDRTSYIHWYNTEDDFNSYKDAGFEGIYTDSVYRVSLNDGMILQVKVQPVGIKEAETIPFAP